MKDGDLDALLAAPLAELDDAGFSARAMRRVLGAHDRRETIEWLGVLIAAAIVLTRMPLTALASAAEYLAVNLGNSLAVAVAVMGIVLTLAFARFAAD